MERYKIALSPMFQGAVKSALLALGPASEKPEQNCAYRLDFQSGGGWLRAKQFTNGTFYLEATDTGLYQQALDVLTQVVGASAVNPAVKAATATKSAVASTDGIRGKLNVTDPYIGTDESGKGDYFGPLVIAGVYVTPETIEKLVAIGVDDSKKLKDSQMKAMAVQIKSIVGPAGFSTIEMTPKRYNELYDGFKKQGKNLNHLLAWGHAKAIETLLQQNPTCTTAIADQFGSEHYIKSQLQTLGKQITLHQTPKAEANVGVAAASILARVQFIQRMEKMAAQWGQEIPPGASAHVTAMARRFVSQHGQAALCEVVKLHFKTTDAVLA